MYGSISVCVCVWRFVCLWLCLSVIRLMFGWVSGFCVFVQRDHHGGVQPRFIWIESPRKFPWLYSLSEMSGEEEKSLRGWVVFLFHTPITPTYYRLLLWVSERVVFYYVRDYHVWEGEQWIRHLFFSCHDKRLVNYDNVHHPNHCQTLSFNHYPMFFKCRPTPTPTPTPTPRVKYLCRVVRPIGSVDFSRENIWNTDEESEPTRCILGLRIKYLPLGKPGFTE